MYEGKAPFWVVENHYF